MSQVQRVESGERPEGRDGAREEVGGEGERGESREEDYGPGDGAREGVQRQGEEGEAGEGGSRGDATSEGIGVEGDVTDPGEVPE